MAIAPHGREADGVTLSVDIRAQLGELALDVQFDAPVGVTVLFGPSGAGKTSVINAIAGLLQPDAGQIMYGKKALFKDGHSLAPFRRRVGYVFQDARLFPHMTVAQNLRYGGTHDYDRLIGVLGLSGLIDRRPNSLSGGEKQRVALGRALMSKPDILLMDEPLAALDGPRKTEVLPYIATLAAEQRLPIIYVTHAMAEVTQLADRLVIIDDGKVALQGAVTDVLADPMAARYFAKRDAGALIACKVEQHDMSDGVTVLSSDAGRILLPGQIGQVGGHLRLRIPAQDVILARAKPEGQSALNALETQITDVSILPNGNFAVTLLAQSQSIWAEVTPLSVRKMGLEAGQIVFAIFKATAVGPT